MCKDGFYFFTNYRNIARDLSPELKAKFLDALMDYAIDGIEPEDCVIKALITAIKPSLDKVEKRGGNHNPTGQNQHKEVKVGQSWLNEVKSGQSEDKVGQSGQSFNKQETRNIKQEILKEKQTKRKISFSDVVDWESLFTYWEENKKGGKYKNEESRQRMLDKLKELTNNDFDLAKNSISHAIDNKYQGFCNGSELFYKPPRGIQINDFQQQKEREERQKMLDQYWED